MMYQALAQSQVRADQSCRVCNKKGDIMPTIGQPAPQFTTQALIENGEFKELSLSDFKGKWAILFFYPLDFTFVCPTELTQFRDCLKDFKNEGAEVLGISVDSVHAHKRWIRDDLGELGYPLLSDITKRISRDYGALLEEQGISTRATFIVDPEGRLQYISLHNLNVGRDVTEILRVLKGLKSGELCGAGWKPGDTFIKAK